MTRFRYPSGWGTNRDPGCRPDISNTWLDPENRPNHSAKLSRKRSYQYWTQIHWATPPWVTEVMWAQVKAIYEAAIPGIHEVDHTVPLKHPLVCGLNVPWNLEVVAKVVNQRKSNHYWPDCPDHLCPNANASGKLFPDDFQLPHQMRLVM